MIETLLTIEEVAKILAVRVPRAYELVRTGIIPSVKLGRQLRVSPTALQDWINKGGSPLDSEVTDVDD